jgi:peptidoglycan L-alanyl-D-glutamate endopeptidase CwlK
MHSYNHLLSSLILSAILIPGFKTVLAQDKSGISKGINGINIFKQDTPAEIISDSDLNFEEAVSGIKIPDYILENLEIVTVHYYGFDGNMHEGQLVINKKVVDDIKEIFNFIKETRFPVNKVVPISEYDWSDEQSMKDNNSSAFNYRFISGTRVISEHASGLAIDINPLLNPYIKNNKSTPEGCSYDTTKAGTISPYSQLVKEFKDRGWIWGGDWKNLKDYQHFEKKLK